LLVWLTLGGGFAWFDSITRSYFPTSLLKQTLCFFALYGGFSMILSQVQALYSTFVIEEKYGFNKTDFKTYVIDFIKQILLGTILGLSLITAIVFIMDGLGEYWWIYAFAFLTAFQFIIMWAYPTFLAPIFNKFTPLEEGPMKEAIMELVKRVDFSCDGLFVMDASKRSSHGNAYFTGLGKKKRIVFFDTLIKTLTTHEVQAVLAHELGHFKRKHIVQGMVKGLVFNFLGLAVLGQLASSAWFYQGLGNTIPSPYMALVLFSSIISVYTFLLIPINSSFSRKHEFEADYFASQNSNARDLISALIKMYRDNASTLTPDLTYSHFYHSHPPALERVQHLEDLITKSL
jgi:STE24 endopeptidase